MSASEEQRRRDLLGGLALAGRAWREATVRFHLALVERQGLSATEEKALGILERHGPLTAGELGQRTGLAPASITGLVDRLARKGLARRCKSPEDGRKVLLEITTQREAGAALFDEVQAGMEALFMGYTSKELETVYHFLTEAARIQKTSLGKLDEVKAL